MMTSIASRTRLALGLVGLLVVAATVAVAESRDIELAIRAGVLTEAQRVIRVQQGDDVTLRWTSDAPVKLHLHGYDIEKALTPGAVTTMTFRARATGRFPITVHGARKGEEATLGYLEVHPR